MEATLKSSLQRQVTFRLTALETEQIIKLCTTDAEKAAFANNPSATTLLYILTAVAKRGTTAICPTCKY